MIQTDSVHHVHFETNVQKRLIMSHVSYSLLYIWMLIPPSWLLMPDPLFWIQLCHFKVSSPADIHIAF